MKRKIGRPKFEITEAICAKAEHLASKGLTVDQIAAVFGVSDATIYERQAENPDFYDALKRGRASGIVDVTNALYEKATVDKDNTAMIFWLKNRAGWVDKQETTTTVEQRHVIDLTGIDNESLSKLERILVQSDTGTSESREVPKVIEGVYEG
tara:strand:+ start:506 stop:964 length:459 start_codon:yes stop_codon:yes gene_type:complete